MAPPKDKRHHTKKWKVAALIKKGEMTPKEICKRVGCSYPLYVMVVKELGQSAPGERQKKKEQNKEIARKIIEKKRALPTAGVTEEASVEEIEAALAVVERQEIEILTLFKEDRDTHKIEFFDPFVHQKTFLDFVRDGKKTVLMVGANQIGKTITSVNMAGSFNLGCKQPWDGQEIFPSTFARENGGKAIIGRILCNDWEKAAKETIVPKLKEWLPVGSYETKKNNVGIESEWYFPKTKSHFSILTYKEDTKSHEGWTGDWVHADEPPPRDKYVANRRGLIARGGVFTMAMTAISEPWILDEIVLTPDRTTGIVADIPIEANTTLSAEDIRVFESTLTEDEKVARIKGGWLQLTGRIWKMFDPNIHVVEPFPNGIPSTWPCEAQIDFHLNLPHAICFTACSPLQEYFVFEEVWQNMSTEDIADSIIKIKKNGSLRMKRAFIDPLSKGDTSYVRNRYGKVEDSFTTIKNILQKEGIALDVGSKDEKSYIRAVETMLKGVNGPRPTLYFFNTCKEAIKQVQRWSYDDNGVPSSDGHFPECIGRQTQTGLKYTDPAVWNRPLRMASCPV